MYVYFVEIKCGDAVAGGDVSDDDTSSRLCVYIAERVH